MNTIIKSTLLAFGTIFLMTGCVATKSYDFRPSEVKMSQKIDVTNKLPYTVIEVNTKLAPDDLRGDIDAVPAMLLENMKSGLDDAIISSGLFSLNGENSIQLDVEILEVDTPPISITFPTDMRAKYIATKDGKLIYSKVISSKAKTESSFSFYGGTRQMESVNRSVRGNIINFLADIQIALSE